jgi:hypothetical protein
MPRPFVPRSETRSVLACVRRPLERWTLAAALLASSGLCGCGKALQERALAKWSHDFCKTTPHRGPGDCDAEVERALPVCTPPFLAKKTTSQQFVQCLGFELPPTAATRPGRVE